MTGTGVPDGTYITQYRTGFSNTGSLYRVFFIDLNNPVPDSSGAVFTYFAPTPVVPTSVSAIAGNGLATVSWAAPASNGGAITTGYTVRSTPGNFTATTTGLTATVNGLTNGTAYTFTVRATNVAGTGPVSDASNSILPTV